MPDDRTPSPPIAVSPDNPCPFLRAAVAEGFVGGHTVPLSMLAETVEAASGTTGLNKAAVGLKTYLVALIANGICTLRPLRSWWSGAQLDELRNGPLDKHGVGSRILDANAHVDETEIVRLAEFGKDRPDPAGGVERGLTASEINAYMDANFARAKGHRRWFDRRLMNGEWPVLLDIMGKGEGANRYLSVAEVRTLFVERRLPERHRGPVLLRRQQIDEGTTTTDERLLNERGESHVLLSTPEINGESNRAWRLYRRLGFTDVIRGYHFAGDPRPFAILGRSLPL